MDHVCPQHLNEDSVIPFLGQLSASRDDPEAGVDFCQMQFGEPFGTVVLAEGLRSFVQYRKQRDLPTHVSNVQCVRQASSNVISYLSHVGFFQYVGLPFGNLPNSGRGSDTYFPITQITRAELTQDRHGDQIQDAIDRRSDKLASLVFDDEMQRLMLSYCFREIIRNVFEHAQVDYCTVMAQKWGDTVEIAIIDMGRGIAESLSETYGELRPERAISLALQPGVSRVRNATSDDRWANSGFGLFVVSELGRRLGQFTIMSSGVAICLNGRQPQAVALGGTAIKLKVNTENAEYFPNVLSGIVAEGEKIHFAKTGVRKSASKSSYLW